MFTVGAAPAIHGKRPKCPFGSASGVVVLILVWDDELVALAVDVDYLNLVIEIGRAHV